MGSPHIAVKIEVRRAPFVELTDAGGDVLGVAGDEEPGTQEVGEPVVVHQRRVVITGVDLVVFVRSVLVHQALHRFVQLVGHELVVEAELERVVCAGGERPRQAAPEVGLGLVAQHHLRQEPRLDLVGVTVDRHRGLSHTAQIVGDHLLRDAVAEDHTVADLSCELHHLRTLGREEHGHRVLTRARPTAGTSRARRSGRSHRAPLP